MHTHFLSEDFSDISIIGTYSNQDKPNIGDSN